MIAWLLKCLGKCRAMSSILEIHGEEKKKQGIVECTFNPRTKDVEIDGPLGITSICKRPEGDSVGKKMKEESKGGMRKGEKEGQKKEGKAMSPNIVRWPPHAPINT